MITIQDQLGRLNWGKGAGIRPERSYPFTQGGRGSIWLLRAFRHATVSGVVT